MLPLDGAVCVFKIELKPHGCFVVVFLQVDKNPDTKSDESPTAEDASAPHRCDTESESRQVVRPSAL